MFNVIRIWSVVRQPICQNQSPDRPVDLWSIFGRQTGSAGRHLRLNVDRPMTDITNFPPMVRRWSPMVRRWSMLADELFNDYFNLKKSAIHAEKINLARLIFASKTVGRWFLEMWLRFIGWHHITGSYVYFNRQNWCQHSTSTLKSREMENNRNERKWRTYFAVVLNRL